jgi:urease accessory protein
LRIGRGGTVRVSLSRVMERDTKKMRGDGPFVFAQVKNGVGVDAIISHIHHAWQHATGVAHHH